MNARRPEADVETGPESDFGFTGPRKIGQRLGADAKPPVPAPEKIQARKPAEKRHDQESELVVGAQRERARKIYLGQHRRIDGKRHNLVEEIIQLQLQGKMLADRVVREELHDGLRLVLDERGLADIGQ